MRLARSTSLIFVVLLLAAIANAQFMPQQGIAVGEPYGANPYAMPQVMPVPSYNPMYMPNSYGSPFMTNPYLSNPYSSNPYMSQPTYNFSLPTQNYTLPAYDYNIPSFSNPYSSPFDDFSSRSRDPEEEEERREREEERREEREERREEKRREREERKREERLERERARRGESPDGNAEKAEVNNWPPVPKSSARAAEVPPPPPPVVAAPPAAAPAAKPARAAEAKPADSKPARAAESKPAAPTNWWESDPAYQKYLKDKKAFEDSQKAKADWPPKPKPVTTVPAPQKSIESTTGPLAASADVCADCGPTKGPLTQQIEQLKKVSDPREVFVLTRPPEGKVSEGIRTVINTIYQSCDAYNTLLRPDYCQDGFIGTKYCAKSQSREAGDLTAFRNPQEFFSYKVASQPGSNVMTPVKPEGPQCRDMNKTPPVFKLGGRPQISTASGKVKLNLYNNNTKANSTNFVTLDCSGFVTAALTAAGLNAVPNSPTSQVTTKSMREGAATCLGPVSFNANESIKSGDIAVFAGESQHAMIFDRVGTDPFGLSEIPALPSGASPEKHCLANLKPSNFDFVIAQSGLYGGRVAVSQSRAVDYIVNFGNGYMDGINLQIVNMAADACVAKLTGSSKKADRPEGAKLLRHKGSSAPGCVRASPPEVVGQQCVKGCT